MNIFCVSFVIVVCLVYIVVYCCLCTAFLSQYSTVYILASKSLTILSLLSTAFFVVDDVSTLSNSESLGSDPVAVCNNNKNICYRE